MTGACERRCTLRAPVPRRHAHWHVRISVCRIPLACVSDHQRHVRGDGHLHTKLRRLSEWAQCTHFQRVHALLHVHTRCGCGIPWSGAQPAAAVCANGFTLEPSLRVSHQVPCRVLRRLARCRSCVYVGASRCPLGVDLKVELSGCIGKNITDPVVAPGPRSPQEGAHDGVRTIVTSRGVTARMMRGRRGKAGVGHPKATTDERVKEDADWCLVLHGREGRCSRRLVPSRARKGARDHACHLPARMLHLGLRARAPASTARCGRSLPHDAHKAHSCLRARRWRCRGYRHDCLPPAHHPPPRDTGYA